MWSLQDRMLESGKTFELHQYTSAGGDFFDIHPLKLFPKYILALSKLDDVNRPEIVVFTRGSISAIWQNSDDLPQISPRIEEWVARLKTVEDVMDHWMATGEIIEVSVSSAAYIGKLVSVVDKVLTLKIWDADGFAFDKLLCIRLEDVDSVFSMTDRCIRLGEVANSVGSGR